MKKLTTLLLVLALVLCTFAAASAEEQVRLAFNDRNRSEPFHISLYEGLKASTEAAGWEYQDAVNEGDTMKHIQANQSFITKQVDIIVDFTCLAESGTKCANDAAAAGIPFISVDVEYGENAYFFGVENYDAGTKLGTAALPMLQEKFGQVDWILKLSNAAISPTIEKRLLGVIDAVKTQFEVPDDRIVVLDCGTDDVKTASLTRDWLNSHPEESNILFIGLSDDRAYAANAQINALDRIADCALVSFNGDPASRTDLKAQADEGIESAWLCSIAFNPQRYGAQIVEFAKDILAGTAEKVRNCETTVLTTENIHDYLQEIGEE